MKRSLMISFFWGILLVHLVTLIARRPAAILEESALEVSESEERETFQDIRFYLTEKKLPRVSFESSRLEIIAGEKASFILPRGKAYDEKGKILAFESESGGYLKKNNSLSLSGDVKVTYEDFLLTCDNGFYDLNQKLFNGEGNVVSNGYDSKTKDQLKVKSEKVFSYPMDKWSRFDGNVKGRISRKRRYQGSFDFEAQQIEVDLMSSKIDLRDDVKIERKNMMLSAQNSSIYLENYTKKLRYYELTDDVVIKQTIKDKMTGESIKRTAYSEKLEGFVRDQKIILTGSPRVLSNEDVIRGSRIILRENASIVEVIDSTSRINYRKQNNE